MDVHIIESIFLGLLVAGLGGLLVPLLIGRPVGAEVLFGS